MRKVSYIILSLLILSCQKEKEIDLSNINLLSVSFLKSNNPSLETDIKLTFDSDNTFSGFAPFESSINSLIATYEFGVLLCKLMGKNKPTLSVVMILVKSVLSRF